MYCLEEGSVELLSVGVFATRIAPHTPAPAARMQSAARMYIPFDLKKLFLLNELSIISASFLRVRCHGVFFIPIFDRAAALYAQGKIYEKYKIKKRKDAHLSVNVLP